MIADGREEPLHQSLLREADSLRSSNPRSALAVAVTALETAVKWLVSHLVPHAAWLVRNLPSPPIFKVLDEYLPQLLQKPKIAKNVLDDVRSVINARNELVHGNRSTVDEMMLERWFGAIRDVVWLCDYFGGVEWAVNRVRPDTLSAMGLSPTVENRGWFVD